MEIDSLVTIEVQVRGEEKKYTCIGDWRVDKAVRNIQLQYGLKYGGIAKKVGENLVALDFDDILGNHEGPLFFVDGVPEEGLYQPVIAESVGLVRPLCNASFETVSTNFCLACGHLKSEHPYADSKPSPAPAPIANLLRIAVGEAFDPHRLMINHSNRSQTEWNAGASMSIAGWTHKMEFWAFSSHQPGTIRIAVGEAHGPHRLMINHNARSQTEWDDGASMSIAGWTHKMEFWAYPSRQPGTIRIAVGQADRPHRLMINHSAKSQMEWDNGASMSIAGWTHKMEFWVYPSNNI